MAAQRGQSGIPILAGLALDAQDIFVAIADSIPQEESAPAGLVVGLNQPGWVIAHAAFFHDCWLNGDAQGRPREHWDPWLLEWAQRERGSQEPMATELDDARNALRRIVPGATAFLTGLTEGDLLRVPGYEEGAWTPGTTVGYLVARSVAHLFAHASELNVIATALGRPDAGLPGRLTATRLAATADPEPTAG